MEDVEKGEVEELVHPEEVRGGEPCGLQAQGGRRDQAGHRRGEDGPQVQQGGVLAEGEQVSSIPGKRTERTCQVHISGAYCFLTFLMLSSAHGDKYPTHDTEPDV